MWRLSILLFANFVLATATELAERQYGGYGGYGSPKETQTTTTSTAAYNNPYATGATTPDSDSYEYYTISSKKTTIAHVTFGALATLLFFPLGIVVPRIARGLTASRWWFRYHQIVQGVFGLGCTVIAISISLGTFSSKSLDTPHRRLAIAFFVMVCVQGSLGAFTHLLSSYRAKKGHTGRGILNYVHWLFGLGTVAVGWATAYYGITMEWEYRGHGRPAAGYKIGWAVIVAFWSAAYVAGLGLLPRQLKRERLSRTGETTAENRFSDKEQTAPIVTTTSGDRETEELSRHNWRADSI